MVNTLQDDFDNLGIDIEADSQALDDDFQNMGIDIEQEAANPKQEPGWLETIGDVFTQAGLGALKLFTWPADVLKLGIIGEGLTDIDELEQAFRKADKPFDREKYVQSVFEAARYVPTQDLAEKGFEELTGISLQPKTELGKGAKQFAGLAAFTPGGVARKIGSAAIGTGTTQALKQAGVGEGKAELIGDVTSLSPAALQKGPRQLSKVAAQSEKTAQKHALPFLEFMTKEREPLLKGRLFKGTENRLKEQFNLSTTEALKKIVEGEIPIKGLRDRGINLDSLAEHAYTVTRKMAQAKPQVIKTDNIVKNIDQEISRIKSLAPSPSEAQKAKIKLLEGERDVLKIAKPSSEQLINQHMNYNADMKQIYKKPEFSGKEEEIRTTYEFLKRELVDAMQQHGNRDVANAFTAANKIYREKSKLYQTENLLQKAFDGEAYNPKKLDKLLNSKQGVFLKRNMGPAAIKELEDIAYFGKQAEERMNKFLDLRSPTIANEIKSWGELASFVLIPHSLKGSLFTIARPLARHIQGRLLMRPGTRDVYKITLKHAAKGSFDLLKKDFSNLENEIVKEFGSLDNFMDDTLSDMQPLEN